MFKYILKIIFAFFIILAFPSLAISESFLQGSNPQFFNSFSVSSQETKPTGITFNNNGTKMFIVGYSGDDVNEYTLATAFDVSTASFIDSFSVSSQEISARDMKFNNTTK